MKRVIDKLSEWSFKKSSTVVTIGNFDGMHRGHQSIIRKAAAAAKKYGKKTVVLTFKPHPVALSGPGRNSFRTLMQPELKYELMRKLGIDFIVVADFNNRFSALSPDDFIEKIIAEKLGAFIVVVGMDFRFGYRKEGNIKHLREKGAVSGFSVETVKMENYGHVKIGSTYIRKLISKGDFKKASHLLGHKYCIMGIVTRGCGRGRKLEYPTANVSMPEGVLVPEGVFKVTAVVKGLAYGGVANIGFNPTFGETSAKTFEVHLVGFSKDIYGEEISVFFEKKIRDEKKFTGCFLLKKQIKKDICSSELCVRKNGEKEGDKKIRIEKPIQ